MEGLGDAIYRRGITTGRVSDILTVLSVKGEVSEKLKQKIQAQSKSELLDQWLKIAAVVPDVETFEEQIMR